MDAETNTIRFAKLNARIKAWIATALHVTATQRKEWEERTYALSTKYELGLILAQKRALQQRMHDIDRAMHRYGILALNHAKELQYTHDEKVAFLVENHKTMKIVYNNLFRSGVMAWPREHPELYRGGNDQVERDGDGLRARPAVVTGSSVPPGQEQNRGEQEQ